MLPASIYVSCLFRQGNQTYFYDSAKGIVQQITLMRDHFRLGHMAKIPGLSGPQALKCHGEVAQQQFTNGTVFQLRFSQGSPKIS